MDKCIKDNTRYAHRWKIWYISNVQVWSLCASVHHISFAYYWNSTSAKIYKPAWVLLEANIQILVHCNSVSQIIFSFVLSRKGPTPGTRGSQSRLDIISGTWSLRMYTTWVSIEKADMLLIKADACIDLVLTRYVRIQMKSNPFLLLR